jgi:hypothetical protein
MNEWILDLLDSDRSQANLAMPSTRGCWRRPFTYIHACMHACRQAGRKAGRQEGRQAGRQADRQTYIRGWVKTYQFINFRVLKVLTQPHIKTARGKRPLAKHLVGRLVGPWGGGILT